MNTLRTFLATLFLMSIVAVPSVYAGTVNKLYSVMLPANHSVQAPTDKQIIEGLKQVLVKVSGSRSIHTNPIIQQQMTIASTFLQQFSFTSKMVKGKKEPALLLDYNSAAVDHLITQTGVKPLGVQRPTVLFWLVSDLQGYQDFLLSDSAAIDNLRSAANARGLPVQLPLLDLDDQTAIQVSDVWGLFAEAVQVSSERYRPDAVIAARLRYSASGVVQLEGVFLKGGKVDRLSYTGTEMSVLTHMVDGISDQLFNPVMSHNLSYFQSGVAVSVSNINSLSRYIQLTNFLKSLPIVNNIKTERVVGDDVILRLELDGGEQQLQQAMSVEPRIQTMEQQVNRDGLRMLSYRWQD